MGVALSGCRHARQFSWHCHRDNVLSFFGHFVLSRTFSHLGRHVVRKCHPATFLDDMTCRPTTWPVARRHVMSPDDMSCRLGVTAFPTKLTTCHVILAKNYNIWGKMADFSMWSRRFQPFLDDISWCHLVSTKMSSEISCCLNIVGDMSSEMSCCLDIVCDMLSEMSSRLGVVVHPWVGVAPQCSTPLLVISVIYWQICMKPIS